MEAPMEAKPDSFFFVHCPKTGTSLFTVLRNSLDACTEKNFTCFGVSGGGYRGNQLKRNAPHQYLQWQTSKLSYTPLPLSLSTMWEAPKQEQLHMWWGISDYWEISVCTFHCKFGGNTTDIELHNTRPVASAGGFETVTLEDFPPNTPTVEDLIPNVTEYVEMHYKSDLLLYFSALELFWKRAELCGCDVKGSI
eukprot:scaffold1550_cov97-Skeletonema_dohrnii-CCMP3373.AAC.3